MRGGFKRHVVTSTLGKPSGKPTTRPPVRDIVILLQAQKLGPYNRRLQQKGRSKLYAPTKIVTVIPNLHRLIIELRTGKLGWKVAAAAPGSPEIIILLN
jgi:hypothetical protein